MSGKIVGKHQKRLMRHQFLIPVLWSTTGDQHDNRIMFLLFRQRQRTCQGYACLRIFKGYLFNPVRIGRFRLLWSGKGVLPIHSNQFQRQCQSVLHESSFYTVITLPFPRESHPEGRCHDGQHAIPVFRFPHGNSFRSLIRTIHCCRPRIPGTGNMKNKP